MWLVDGQDATRQGQQRIPSRKVINGNGGGIDVDWIAAPSTEIAEQDAGQGGTI